MHTIVVIDHAAQRFTAGQLGAGQHVVELLITGTIPYGVQTISTQATVDRIRIHLNNQGWDVTNVAYVSGGWFTFSHTYRVWANVDDQYSDAMVSNNIRRDLAGTFDISDATIVSNPWSGAGGAQPPATQPSAAVNTTVHYAPPGTHSDTSPGTTPGTDWLSTFTFGGLTGVTAAAALLLIFVALKD